MSANINTVALTVAGITIYISIARKDGEQEERRPGKEARVRAAIQERRLLKTLKHNFNNF